MKYVLDTNIILFYLRDKAVKKIVDEEYKLFRSNDDVLISVVTLGEIRSIARRNRWGSRRIETVETFLNKMIIMDVGFRPIIDAYVEIDTFSQGKHETKQLNLSARNMGKNDLWIAATALATSSKLMTTDKDFLHLDKAYFDLVLIET